MTFSKVFLTALLAASATVGFVAVASAQDNSAVATASATNSASKLIAAENASARTALYSSLIGTNFQSADSVMTQVVGMCSGEGVTCSQAKMKAILEEILAYLSMNGADQALVASLSDKYATQLAFNTNVDTAAGPDSFGTGLDFGVTDDGNNQETLENANQVSGNRPQ